MFSQTSNLKEQQCFTNLFSTVPQEFTVTRPATGLATRADEFGDIEVNANQTAAGTDFVSMNKVCDVKPLRPRGVI